MKILIVSDMLKADLDWWWLWDKEQLKWRKCASLGSIKQRLNGSTNSRCQQDTFIW